MKKYRLIKEYPSSPNVGEIATFREETEDYVVNNPYYQLLPKRWVENYPEFWEKIVEESSVFFRNECGFAEIVYEGNKMSRLRWTPKNK